ncbi:MAG: UDP-4-amino-4,6-dideoxy-N-acetyl-beta-L-altrosamine transaminase [Candidatus Omnitrophica bacterium]|nr:UDP-4-amino-4,6-dideoxy-N-acetyl-beta-L-altrosamine transaminase [Candidatus Omnitrophota bacterium]
MRVQTAPKSELALHGGVPVRRTLLPYARHTVTEADIEAVAAVLRSSRLTTGPKVAEFEEAVSSYVRAREAVAFSSGTAALHAAAFAAGLGPGDEAVTTPLTFCATANAALYQGARPAFADVRDDTLNLDPAAVEARLTPRTKAVLPVDYAGHPADLEALLALAARQGLTVIEDACHALGAADRGRKVGGISHMTVFSFHPIKAITTGEGGMVTTNEAALAKRLRLFRNHGIDSDPNARQASGAWFYEMTALGFNYRLTDLGCALGLSQLSRLDAALAHRRAIALRYLQAFAAHPELVLPAVRPESESAWHLFPVRLVLERLSADRAEIIRALHAEGIGVNVHYLPVYRHPYYVERFGDQAGTCPVAEAAYERLISLPLFAGMTDQDVEDVIRAVTKVCAAYAR